MPLGGKYMLLFSTILEINDLVTEEDFLSLVFEWNKTSKYKENVVQGIDWQGERNARFGDARLWMQIMEYADQGIIAVRHEKIADDGVIWDSDFIMNFRERRLAIQLDRTYSEEALVMDAAFSTPHFITLLIEHGFLKDDGDLPVLRTPITVSDEELSLLASVFSGSHDYLLPVVYVTKTAEGKDPVSMAWLASRLKGAAHVLVEESPDCCAGIRDLCRGSRDLYGAVRIFYPANAVRKKKFLYRSATGNESVRLEKIIRNVIQYWIAQKVDRLYTWQGVAATLLNQQLDQQVSRRLEAEQARQKAEDEVEKVYEEFDEDLRDLQEKVAELTKANDILRFENQGLRARLASSDGDGAPIIFSGDEEEFYQGEIRDMVLGTLDEALSATENATRRADVLTDILDNNTYYHLSDDRRKRIKDLFRGYKSLSGAMIQELVSLGFEIKESGKHYKLTYHGDQRYMVTVGKTPSDNRSGSNNAALISKTML